MTAGAAAHANEQDEEQNLPAELRSIEPASAYIHGSTRVRIAGARFKAPVKVWVGHAPCAEAKVSQDGSEIGCVAPPHPSGTVDLMVKTPTGILIKKSAFSYIPKFSRVEDLLLKPDHLILREGMKKTFTASGGTPPYQFAVTQGTSKIDEKSGELTGARGPDWGVVQVTDSKGLKRATSYYVPEKLKGFPETVEVLTDQAITVSATGGEPPYTLEMIKGPGKFYPEYRAYLAPNMLGKAVIRVTDVQEDQAEIQIVVKNPPAPPPRLIAVGDDFSCAAPGGVVSCWGASHMNQLGNADSKNTSLATPVQALSASVDSIVAGLHHACVLINGGVKCWGDNQYGQLGDGTTTARAEPVDVIGLDSGVLAIAAGDFHTCAALSSTVVCWGKNDNGQLGDGTLEPSAIPILVSGLEGQIGGISGGAFHSCAIASGVAKCWGKNQNGQLGTGNLVDQLVPIEVTELTPGVQAISAGRAHTCAVESGHLKCWGFNGIGNLGLNNSENKDKPFEVQLSGANIVASRQYHSCAVSTGGLYCWGYNYQGQVGDSSYVNRSAPVAVQGLSSAKDVATGNYHTCAITTSDQIFCWGENYFGQLGNGFNASKVTPVQVKFKPVRKHL